MHSTLYKTIGAFHLLTQVNTTSFYLSWYSRNNKDRTILVLTYVIKWKVPNYSRFMLTYLLQSL